MKAEMIAIGNEIVFGHTINTNASLVAQQLEKIGIEMCYQSGVRDRYEDIANVLEIALKRVDLVILSGGLGPTKDDLTKEAVFEYFDEELIFNETAMQDIKNYFEHVQKTMTENNMKQALFPANCIILKNICGTASGCLYQTSDKKFVALLPGPPKELRPMLQILIDEHLKQKVEGVYLTEDIKLFGIGESEVVGIIDEFLGVFENIEIAPYVAEGCTTIRIKSFGINKEEAHTRLIPYKKSLEKCLAPYIIGNNDKQIEQLVYENLEKLGATIAVAESCTGGLLAGRLINNSGISRWLKESFVTYSNEAKSKYLGVSIESLKNYGAVSEEVAEEMARGVANATNSDIGVATTGIAGPDGGTEEKPVGLVYISVAIYDKCYTYKRLFTGERQEIRQHTVQTALYYLYKQLKRLENE
ncbi:MAG: competence/damage-inducible protein A [Epulopiscium sp. Nele67-Bin005]|nr:MAG: competence/damage-inducible protein A [Epulopiscium sp. Nele67-Bin005]